MTEPTAAFVYGTLKRGQAREKCWPRQPVGIEIATVRGALYDLGRYPGLAEGSDTVVGEVWRLRPEELTLTLAVLDEIEGCNGLEDDEYRRVTIECATAGGTIAAWTYRYARLHELTPDRRIKPDVDGLCRWPRSQH